jgi:hypothetical protein
MSAVSAAPALLYHAAHEGKGQVQTVGRLSHGASDAEKEALWVRELRLVQHSYA